MLLDGHRPRSPSDPRRPRRRLAVALAVAIPVAVLECAGGVVRHRAHRPGIRRLADDLRRVGARPRRRPARRHRGELVVRPQPADGRCSRGGNAAHRRRAGRTAGSRRGGPTGDGPTSDGTASGAAAAGRAAGPGPRGRMGAEPGRRCHSGALQRLLPAERRLPEPDRRRRLDEPGPHQHAPVRRHRRTRPRDDAGRRPGPARPPQPAGGRVQLRMEDGRQPRRLLRGREVAGAAAGRGGLAGHRQVGAGHGRPVGPRRPARPGRRRRPPEPATDRRRGPTGRRARRQRHRSLGYARTTSSSSRGAPVSAPTGPET